MICLNLFIFFFFIFHFLFLFELLKERKLFIDLYIYRMIELLYLSNEIENLLSKSKKKNTHFEFANRLPYGVSFFSILMVLSAVIGASVGAGVVSGTTIAQSGPAKPGSQKHRFMFVQTYLQKINRISFPNTFNHFGKNENLRLDHSIQHFCRRLGILFDQHMEKD